MSTLFKRGIGSSIGTLEDTMRGTGLGKGEMIFDPESPSSESVEILSPYGLDRASVSYFLIGPSWLTLVFGTRAALGLVVRLFSLIECLIYDL